MLTAKQRAYLRGMANNINSVMQIGKNDITPYVTKAVDELLEARELVKLNILESCKIDIRQVAETLSERTRSDVVQVIGRKIILYRKSKENPKLVLS